MSLIDLAPDIKPAPRARWVGFDLVRLLSFVAISIHHFFWVIWYEVDATAVHASMGWRIAEAYARLISFSGHSILFLSAFLIAHAESRSLKTWRVVAFVAAGWILFCFFEYGENPVFWTWDIYPLIVAGFASAVLVRKCSKRAVYLLGAAGFAMTWIPFWNWSMFNGLDLQWRHWLVGDCTVDLADWPILPWIGFIWMPYALGAYARESELAGADKIWKRFHKFEYALWPSLFLLSIPNLGAYWRLALGPQFACDSFRQPPFVFWSHFVFIVFLLRVSLVTTLQKVLVERKWVRWVSELRISKSFGLAYLVHYTVIELSRYTMQEVLRASVPFSFLILVLILPTTELIVRILEAGAAKIFSFRRGVSAK